VVWCVGVANFCGRFGSCDGDERAVTLRDNPVGTIRWNTTVLFGPNSQLVSVIYISIDECELLRRGAWNIVIIQVSFAVYWGARIFYLSKKIYGM